LNDLVEAKFQGLILEVWRDLHRPDVLWQIAALASCLVLAWALARGFRRRSRMPVGAKWQFGVESLNRVLFPLFVLTLLLVAREALRPYMSVSLLDLAVPLAGSAALIRFLVYTLRYAFGPSSVLVTFERLISVVVWGAVALHIVGVLPHLIEGLDAVQFAVGRQRISLWLVLQALFWATLTVLAALWAGSAVESRLLRAETLDANLRVAFARLAKAFLVFLAVVIALPMVGIDLTVLSVFGGALGVGLGFGLQKIASNYVSGFILLLERSVRIGDMVTVDQFYGEVKDITTRYVVVRALDGREAIIPNELLITSKVLNHSYTDRRVRHELQVQVAYRSDAERALRLLQEIAARQPRVMSDPPPLALLTGFADSGVNLELGFWIRDPEQGVGEVKSRIGLEILQTFREEGIEIPYPQREVRLLESAAGDKMPPPEPAG
jgi:small-conductance mechanosensitive channel